MKQALLNLFFALIAFILVYGIALLTGLTMVQEGVLIAFVIQWICFIPAYFFQTEKFYDLAGSCTYLVIVGYVSYQSYSSLNLTAASLLLATCISLWAIRLGTFLFLRIHRAKEDKRFRDIKPAATRFFMAWTLQGMWVCLCSMCALTAIASQNGVLQNGFFFGGLLVFGLGFGVEFSADWQKSNFRKNPGNKELFITSDLWKYARHPNYFGEIVLWTGIALMSFSSLHHWQYITLISPLFTYFLLVYISGVRILEASGMEKWGHLESYQQYIHSTPSLIPFSKLLTNKKFSGR